MRLAQFALAGIAVVFCLGSTPEKAAALQPKEWRAKVTIKNILNAPAVVVLDGQPAFLLAVTIPAGGKSQFTGLLEGVPYTVNYDLDLDGSVDKSFNAFTVRGNSSFFVYQ